MKLVPQAKAATDEDYYTEYLAAIISVKVVAGIDAAIAERFLAEGFAA